MDGGFGGSGLLGSGRGGWFRGWFLFWDGGSVGKVVKSEFGGGDGFVGAEGEGVGRVGADVSEITEIRAGRFGIQAGFLLQVSIGRTKGETLFTTGSRPRVLIFTCNTLPCLTRS